MRPSSQSRPPKAQPLARLRAIAERFGKAPAILALLLSAGCLLVQGASEAAESGLSDAKADAIVARLMDEFSDDEAPAVSLDLAKTIRIAVENNPALRSRADVPAEVSQQILASLAAYEPELFVATDTNDSTRAAASRLDGVPTSSPSERDQRSVETALGKTLRSGADVGLRWSNTRTSSNSAFAIHNPEYAPLLRAGIDQPLLRNFGGLEQSTTVLIARQETEQAFADFEAELAEFVSEVSEAYWDQVLAEAQLGVEQHSLKLAEELLRAAERGVDVGLLPPVAIKEARAETARRQEQLLRVNNRLTVAMRELQYKVRFQNPTQKGPLRISPSEDYMPDDLAPVRAVTLKTALTQRPEVRAASIALETAYAEERLAGRRKLPQLNLIARYGFSGLAGTTRDPDIVDGEERLSPFEGDYEDSIDSLFSGDYPQYQVRLELRVDLANAVGRSEEARTDIAVRRRAADLEAVISDIALDVDRSLADLGSAYERVGASKLSRELAEENLHNQRRRYELGSVTTKDVLDFQSRLTQAQALELTALIDHARAVTQLDLARGTLLEAYDIRVESPDSKGTPWWARF